jgi:hypothetical protein
MEQIPSSKNPAFVNKNGSKHRSSPAGDFIDPYFVFLCFNPLWIFGAINDDGIADKQFGMEL